MWNHILQKFPMILNDGIINLESINYINVNLSRLLSWHGFSLFGLWVQVYIIGGDGTQRGAAVIYEVWWFRGCHNRIFLYLDSSKENKHISVNEKMFLICLLHYKLTRLHRICMHICWISCLCLSRHFFFTIQVIRFSKLILNSVSQVSNILSAFVCSL